MFRGLYGYRFYFVLSRHECIGVHGSPTSLTHICLYDVRIMHAVRRLYEPIVWGPWFGRCVVQLCNDFLDERDL